MVEITTGAMIDCCCRLEVMQLLIKYLYILYNNVDPVLALSQLSYTFAEATEETGEICVVLEGPSGGLATGTLEVIFTIDTGNINRPAS